MDPAKPPPSLVAFLAHAQISYEASYISRHPVSTVPDPSASSITSLGSLRLSTPPRATSSKARSHVPPSIFPPNTPNPTPVTAEQDKQYVKSEGAVLASGVWGEGQNTQGKGKEDGKQGMEAFALLWEPEQKEWIAVYRMTVNVGECTLVFRGILVRYPYRLRVAFLRMSIRDPLLCLTVSITVREKPVPVTPVRKPLTALIESIGGLPISPISHGRPGAGDDENEEKKERSNKLEEINLLQGLLAGTAVLCLSDDLCIY